MDVGQSVAVGGYEFSFTASQPGPGPNYRACGHGRGVSRDGRLLKTLHPEKRIYNARGMPMTNAAIDVGVLGDLYVSLGEPVPGTTSGAWSVRVYFKPFIDWIWAGAFLMALGGFLAICDRRYRLAVRSDGVHRRRLRGGG